MALAFPERRMERLAWVIPTRSASSLLVMFRSANNLSKAIIIGTLKWLNRSRPLRFALV